MLERPGEGIDTVIARAPKGNALPAEVEILILEDAARDGVGNALGNHIRGNALWNRLYGNGGSDTLEGGGGRDSLYGGSGRDVFVLGRPGSGTDVLCDLAPGLDRMDLRGTGIRSFDEAMAWIDQSGADLVLDLGAGGRAILPAIPRGALGAADFLFDA